ncbi:hypothetical protein GCM10010193_44990 [Kitasatospora atroaurantiaca]|uniref:Uncharacterized protein n=1 Tax=Kitasatospora atroaurantiaca TaxID=285545 RepID=A0A561EZT4_9ACTN|nr:hypothetical protein [Kitasatospora atroaurantiaca]TWE21119.1 hypothetical protein FB465_6286 [Kitasatospora atroaurantiaca]
MRTRPAAILTALVLTGLLTVGTSGPAAAHGDAIHFEFAGPAGGHPQTVATWENDGDPVTEDVSATLSAVSADGRSLGPWRLIAVPGHEATFTTREELPAGKWTVTVESGFPALGRGEAEITVTPAPRTAGPSVTPAAASAGPVVTPTPTPTAAAAAGDGRSGSSMPVGWIAVGVSILAGLAVAAAVLRRRRA